MDLIEVLWKQDVDLGYNPIIPALNPAQQKEANSEDEIEKLKALLELKTDKVSVEPRSEAARFLLVLEAFLALNVIVILVGEIIRNENINTSSLLLLLSPTKKKLTFFRSPMMRKIRTIHSAIHGLAYRTPLIPKQVSLPW